MLALDRSVEKIQLLINTVKHGRTVTIGIRDIPTPQEILKSLSDLACYVIENCYDSDTAGARDPCARWTPMLPTAPEGMDKLPMWTLRILLVVCVEDAKKVAKSKARA